MYAKPAQIHRILSKLNVKLNLFTTNSPKKMASTDWKVEKDRVLKLPIEEKRKLYKSKEFVTVSTLETWQDYAAKNDIMSKIKPSGDDVAHFDSEIQLKKSLNKVLASKVSIFRGDITQLEVDAIVNAANSRLKAGGGVDGAIHRAAGPLLQAECDVHGGCRTGEAVLTGGYNLPAKYVVHTVGPQDGSKVKLDECYKNCFKIAKDSKIRSIAFPCISTGIYGFPNRLAGHIALLNARKYLESDSGSSDRIIFCTFMPVDVEIYETLMQLYFPVE